MLPGNDGALPRIQGGARYTPQAGSGPPVVVEEGQHASTRRWLLSEGGSPSLRNTLPMCLLTARSVMNSELAMVALS